MDLLTAMALAPQQPPNTVLGFVARFPVWVGGRNNNTFYCRIDCFCQRGIASGWEAEEFYFAPYNEALHGDEWCACRGDSHRVMYPHPR